MDVYSPIPIPTYPSIVNPFHVSSISDVLPSGSRHRSPSSDTRQQSNRTHQRPASSSATRLRIHLDVEASASPIGNAARLTTSTSIVRPSVCALRRLSSAIRYSSFRPIRSDVRYPLCIKPTYQTMVPRRQRQEQMPWPPSFSTGVLDIAVQCA